MKIKTILLVSILATVGFAAACSTPNANQPTTSNANTAKTSTTNTNDSAKPKVAEKEGGKEDEVPAAVKAAFPDAQNINKQHKDLTAAQIATIEKESGAKLGDTDFHNFVAYGTDGSKRTQLGAATVVDIDANTQLVVVYTNDISIKKVVAVKGSGDATAPAFLDQFTGKDHDLPFHVGKDLKYSGSNQAAAEAIAHAVHRDILAMQTLYGKAHSH
jgi:hypothetical protein